MTRTAQGTFEVSMQPEPPYDASFGVSLARVSLDKTFKGDLEGASTGQMIAARPEVKGSAGYVALERFVGSIHGRAGSFVLQHFGVMTRGVGELTISVVPDTGTGELTGLAGRMKIEVVAGKHLYAFEYSFDALPPAERLDVA